MDEKVKIEGRIVNSLLEMFGNIGGLREFLSAVTFVVIGGI